MAYKRVVLTERDNSLKTSIERDTNFESGSVKKQLSKFDTSYTSKKLHELYNEFDSITFNNPTISAETIIKENVSINTEHVINFRTKLYLCGAIIITLLLLFLAIYNIFVIKGVNSGIKILQEDISQATVTYNNLYNENLYLNKYENIIDGVNKAGFSENASYTVINLPPLTKHEAKTVVTNTNWFDAFCNFIAEVLGG